MARAKLKCERRKKAEDVKKNWEEGEGEKDLSLSHCILALTYNPEKKRDSLRVLLACKLFVCDL